MQHVCVLHGLLEVVRLVASLGEEPVRLLHFLERRHSATRASVSLQDHLVACSRPVAVTRLSIQPGQLGQRNTLLVFVALRSLVALNGFSALAHLLVAAAERGPHARVLGLRVRRNTEVVRRIALHLVDLVGLTEAVPGAEVGRVSVDCGAIRLYSGRRVLHLEVLVAHQSPGRYKLAVKLDGAHEVEHALLVVASQTIVVTDDAAALWAILVILEDAEGEMSQISVVLPDVENIRVEVEVFVPLRIGMQQLLEPIDGIVVGESYVTGVRDLVHEEHAVLEVSRD